MKFTIEDIRKQFNERHYILLDEEYINQRQTMHFICEKHKEYGEQTIVYANFKYKHNGCHFCAQEKFQEKQRTSVEEVKRLTEEKGLIFVGITYSSENNHTYAIVQYICPKHRYVGIQESPLWQIKKGKYGCNYCNFVLDTTTFKEKLERLHIDYFDVIGEYKGQYDDIEIRCKKHQINYFAKPYKIFNGTNSCPLCHQEDLRTRNLLSKDEAEQKLHLTHPMLNIIGNYIDTFTPVKLHCNEHNYDFECSINNYLYKGKQECCPKCQRTSGELFIINFLEKYNYKYSQQKTFSECRVKQPLPFDFYLDDFNICIEYQGEQHYYAVDWFGGEKQLKKQQKYDEIKRKFCDENHIKLIEIPYWEKDNLNDYLWNQLKSCGAIKEIA